MTDILEITDLEVTYQRSILALHGRFRALSVSTTLG